MNAYITLDYELYMGNVTGTPERCLIEPMDALTRMLDRHGVRLNVFVDAAYLLQLRRLKDRHPQLQHDYRLVSSHIRRLSEQGHAIQLHLHPQWVYSTFDGERWHLDTDHYKLGDMPLNEQLQLIKDGTELLNSITNRSLSAFRGGATASRISTSCVAPLSRAA